GSPPPALPGTEEVSGSPGWLRISRDTEGAWPRRIRRAAREGRLAVDQAVLMRAAPRRSGPAPSRMDPPRLDRLIDPCALPAEAVVSRWRLIRLRTGGAVSFDDRVDPTIECSSIDLGKDLTQRILAGSRLADQLADRRLLEQRLDLCDPLVELVV